MPRRGEKKIDPGSAVPPLRVETTYGVQYAEVAGIPDTLSCSCACGHTRRGAKSVALQGAAAAAFYARPIAGSLWCWPLKWDHHSRSHWSNGRRLSIFRETRSLRHRWVHGSDHEAKHAALGGQMPTPCCLQVYNKHTRHSFGKTGSKVVLKLWYPPLCSLSFAMR